MSTITDFAPSFYTSPKCRQYQTLIHEASRVGGDYTETTTPDVNGRNALGQVFQNIAKTPNQGFYNTRQNKCFLWLDDFLKNYPDYDPHKNPKLSLGDGSLVLEPLEIDTKGGQSLVTARSALGRAAGSMTAHGVVRVTFNPANGNPSTGYFDLGSSTNLGNYGGADHWFWPNTPGLGFEVEMDVEGADPYVPSCMLK